MGRLAAAPVLLALALATTSCATYRGTAVNADAALPAREPGWLGVSDLTAVRQEGDKDCGAAALATVLGFWGTRTTPEQVLSGLHHAPNEGVAAGELTSYARARGFDAYVFHGAVSDIEKELREGRPLIAGVAKPYGERWLKHYEVIAGFHPATQMVLTFDPARGFRKNTMRGFLAEWDPVGRVVIVVFPAERADSPAAPRALSRALP
jgi:ABC-type bacteriocin/lantibiotic exporter with double-glycine peptidase domain